jgi:hypothetical protein
VGTLVPAIDKIKHVAFEVMEGEDDATKCRRMEQWVKDLEDRLTTQAWNDEKAREKFLACLFLASTAGRDTRRLLMIWQTILGLVMSTTQRMLAECSTCLLIGGASRLPGPSNWRISRMEC